MYCLNTECSGFLINVCFRSLLENHPKFFSFGAVSKQGVPKQKVKQFMEVWIQFETEADSKTILFLLNMV